MKSLTRKNFLSFRKFIGGRELLNYYCEQIPGDAMLYSMFKIDSEAVKCPPPLKGRLTFNLFIGALLLMTRGCKVSKCLLENALDGKLMKNRTNDLQTPPYHTIQPPCFAYSVDEQ